MPQLASQLNEGGRIEHVAWAFSQPAKKKKISIYSLQIQGWMSRNESMYEYSQRPALIANLRTLKQPAQVTGAQVQVHDVHAADYLHILM